MKKFDGSTLISPTLFFAFVTFLPTHTDTIHYLYVTPKQNTRSSSKQIVVLFARRGVRVGHEAMDWYPLVGDWISSRVELVELVPNQRVIRRCRGCCPSLGW